MELLKYNKEFLYFLSNLILTFCSLSSVTNYYLKKHINPDLHLIQTLF